MKTRLTKLAVTAALCLGALAVMGSPALALDPYDTPIVTCDDAGLYKIVLKVCGGANTGALAGITIQYKKVSDWQVSGWDDDGTLCKLSLSGQPSLQHPDKSRWELLPGECETIALGDINFDETGVSGNECSVNALECGTDYVIRVFAHAGRRLGRSDWTADVFCSTLPCENGCTLTQGFWKTHGPGACAVASGGNQWPVTSLQLGNVTYSDAQICAILGQPAGGNGLIALAHQLIAAKFNLLSGADGSCISAQITAADALIGNLVVPPVGGGFLAPKVASGLTKEIDLYNNGMLGCASHCANFKLNTFLAPGVKKTWGQMKTIYR